ncbi:MAG: YIP1 family protein [Lachnospiraceae bacterium]|nr:YIP1 family protein [Lachnospiraceae bacterium]
MKKLGKILLAAILICATLTPVMANAATPYKTYTVDGYGYVTETQTAYTPYETIEKIGEQAFVTPVDLCLDEDGLMYIADSGLKKIIVADSEGNFLHYIGEGILNAPTGVYVSADKRIYVADKGAKLVYVFNEAGEVIETYGKPTSPIYGADLDFKPMKIVANESGTLYLICEGNTNGIVQISPVDGGTFLGYFGTNFTNLSAMAILQRMILSDAQRAKLLSNIPSTPTNLAIDEKGLIYTVTQGDGDYSLKKLNIAGNNLIVPDAYDEQCAAVTTGNFKNIYVASSNGYVYEYNSEGELLFVFGGRDDGRQRVGLCSKVEAIAVDKQDRIYLLDSDKKQVNIYEPTEFTNLLHEALELYAKGRYEESMEPLTKVLEMNTLFDYANKAMGRAYLQIEDYDNALKYARLSKDLDGYSDSYWEIRNLWLKNNLVTAFFVIVALVILVKVLKYLQAKKGIFNPIKKAWRKVSDKTLYQQVRYSTYFIKHPIDGCYGVRREGKASFLCSMILLVAFIVISIINKYYCGFLFKNVREGRYNLVQDIGSVLLIFFALTACNYLVVTIKDGEGSFKQLVSAYAYCLTPYIILMPFLIVISNMITYNEYFIIQFAMLCIYAWVLILIFMAIKEVNNYTVKETVVVIILTLFTLLIAALILFIVYVLCSQAIDFVTTVCREVVNRFE